jgi:hypothetical protein
MTVLWCGGEDIDFIENTAGSIDQYSGESYRRVNYSRTSLRIGAGKSLYLSNTFTPVSNNIWFHCYMVHQSGACDTDSFPFGLRNSVTGDAIGFGFNDLDYFSIGKKTSDGTVTWFVSDSFERLIPLSLFSVDIHVETYGLSGSMHFYIDGNLILTYSGDITVGSTTEFDQIQLGYINLASWGTYISEIIVADEDTRLMSLKTLAPNAAGDVNQWENDYDSIDEVEISDADTVYTDTVEEDAQFNLTGMPTGDFICKAVKVTARVSDGVGGIGMQMGIKTNSALHFGDTNELEGSWETIEELYTQNPETLNRFTPAEIEALQIAFRSKSTA